jgi:hypothetical protein
MNENTHKGGLVLNMRSGFMLLTLLLSMSFICQASVPDTPEYVTASDQSTLTAWLASHPEYSIASDRNCNCETDIQSIRKGSGGVWKPNPRYHPYYVRGDFNGDKKTDFAVILINTKENGKRYLAIFNGPYKAGSNPVYLSPEEGALFYGPPRPKPYRLIVGDFGTEGASLEPKGNGYELVGDDSH